MNILVINAGSSSIKYQLIDMNTELPLSSGIVERIGLEMGLIKHKTFVNGSEEKTVEEFPIPDHGVGLKRVAELLTDKKVGVISEPSEIQAVGHRLVHGGETFTETVEITDEVKAKVKELFPLAPLHNPANLIGVEVAEKVFPNAKQVGVFDTAFHQSIPEKAFRYALPEKFYSELRIRKYGFHGTSHKFISEKAIEYLGNPDAKIVTIHLGNGASMAAVKGGVCVDTTMGMGPLSGLIMGTRSGDIDPAIIFYLAQQKGYSIDEISDLLNKESGMKGLTGLTDMRDVEKLQGEGDPVAVLALEMYAYRVKQYIGSYASAMNGVDAIVFTAGIGENKTSVREMVCEDMDYLGITWDEEKDKNRNGDVHEINVDGAKVKVLIIPTNEELEIAKQSLALMK
ncbi:acetate kinase [Draconibacterium orientale]|uniref:Acetate kinase n=1 Tax=Draconibacterium orientale TaxID=1168034 RepID=X5DBH7_9BACT|nr:acetate kinase [Draconibacterium orientale]AHW60173.1 acetate kinase [Draconibacterium orientale]SES97641.1 acetate kinase [Draconibacterium orientale]